MKTQSPDVYITHVKYKSHNELLRRENNVCIIKDYTNVWWCFTRLLNSQNSVAPFQLMRKRLDCKKSVPSTNSHWGFWSISNFHGDCMKYPSIVEINRSEIRTASILTVNKKLVVTLSVLSLHKLRMKEVSYSDPWFFKVSRPVFQSLTVRSHFLDLFFRLWQEFVWFPTVVSGFKSLPRNVTGTDRMFSTECIHSSWIWGWCEER